jgi:hypothetical protein
MFILARTGRKVNAGRAFIAFAQEYCQQARGIFASKEKHRYVVAKIF